MNKKKSFVLRLNSDVYDALEKWAADEFRSTNGQLEYIISEALKKAGRRPKKQAEDEKQAVGSRQ
ncbi:MAG: Arc family DNA-binding protein [Bacteroidia bacterium]|nr:Arc family DNA-binding protein [Bacteroidia bacterium]